MPDARKSAPDPAASQRLPQPLSPEVCCPPTDLSDIATDPVQLVERHQCLLFKTMFHGVTFQDAEGRILSMNPAAEQILGLSPAELRGHYSLEFAHLTIREDSTPFPGDQQPSLVALRTGQPVRGVVMGVWNRRENARRWIKIDAVPIFAPGHHRPVQVYTTFLDITPQKQVEEALHKEHGILDAILQSTDVLLVYLDRDFNFVAVNAAYAQTCRMRPEDMIGKNHFALYPHPENESIFRRCRDTGQPVFHKDKPFVFPDQPERGVTYWDWSLIPVKDPAGAVVGLVLSLRETTSFVRARAALQTSEERYHAMLQAIPSMTFEGDPAGRNTFTSEQWCAYTGMTPEEIVGMGWTRAVHPDDLPLSVLRWDMAMKAGMPCEMRHRLRAADGSYRWFLVRAVPVRDASGRVLRWAGSSTDIHDLVETQEALRRSEQAAEAANAAKDRFLAMLSHELRTPLTPVLGTVDLLLNTPGLPPEIKTDLRIIRRNAELEARLIDDLLDVTRITRGKLQLNLTQVDAHAALHNVLRICGDEALAKGLSLDVRLTAAEHVLQADLARFQQICWNLLKNAIKFTPGGGRIVLRTSNPHPGRLRLEVSDTGVGIPPEFLDRIFHPFDQGHPDITRRFGGLGLGLTISKMITELHGGTIHAFSEGAQRGASFVVELPLVAQAPQVADAPAPGGLAPAPLAGRTVLLVEDHTDTAQIMQRLLGAMGLRVTPASGVRDALAFLQQRSFDVILSDIGLPDGSGVDLLRQARQHCRTPAIAISGYGTQEDVDRCLEAGFQAHLTKPIDVVKLEDLLQRLAPRDAASASGVSPSGPAHQDSP